MSTQSDNSLLQRAGPIGVLLMLFAICIAWLSLARGAMVAMELQRLSDVPQLWRLFLMGVRMDVIVVCQLFALPTLMLLMLPNRPWRDRAVAILLTLFALLLICMELSTPNFLAEYDRRPDRIYYEYLRYPREVFGTLFKSYPLQLLAATILLGALGYGFWRFSQRRLRATRQWSWTQRLIALPIVAALLFVGIRSSFGHRAASMSTAAYSDNRLVNELAVSSNVDKAASVLFLSVLLVLLVAHPFPFNV